MNRAEILDQRIRSIAQRERDDLAELVVELRELDAMNGYLDLKFQSLFDYLTNGVGYSNGAAQRRIDACRLSRDVPDLSARLQTGAIDLHHITTVCKAVRQASKKRKVLASEKRAIISQLEDKNGAKTQQMAAEFFDLEVIMSTKTSVQKDQSVRYEITMSHEAAAILAQAQALISHAVPSGNVADFLEYVSRKIVKEKTEKPRERKPKAAATVAVEVDDELTATVAAEPGVTATMAVKSDTPVSPRLHREVRSEQPNCANCGSAWFPQTDHRRERWAGGTNARENLQTLCGPCNRAKYRSGRKVGS